MKRYTKTLFIVLVAVAFVATGCKKESEYKTVTLGAKIAPGNSKVYIDGYTPKWNGGDVVNVNGNPITVSNVNGASAELHDVTESDDGYYAYYPAGDVTGFNNGQFTVTLPSVQEYEETTDANSQTVQLVKAPMGAKTDGGSLTFHNLCSLLKVTVTVDAGATLKIAEIKVTAGTTNLSGSTSINLLGDATYALPAPATGSKSVTLSFGNSGKTLEDGNHVFYIYLPAFTSQDVSVEVYNIDANNVLGVKKETFNDISVSANTINTVGTGSLTEASFTTIGALSGLFSVSADKKVRFSKGNLQYQASGNGTWKFADNQYAYIGRAAGNTTAEANRASQSDWIDLFGWGTSGNNHGATAYQPYGISENSADYYAYGISNLNLYNGNGTADWGSNTIDNTTGEWRTLKADEWVYLLSTRTGNQVDHSWMMANIKRSNTNYYYGIIIFPDGYDFGDNDATIRSLLINSTISSDALWAAGTPWADVAKINLSNWTVLQNTGCVFLPAAGVRIGLNVYFYGSIGYYWSSSSSASDALYLHFSDSEVLPQYGNERSCGSSVRLVQE